MITVTINDESRSIENDTTVSQLLALLGLKNDTVAAVSINSVIAKKDRWETTVIADGDRVELLAFVGGGC
ncbi:hypothetical protein AGMMS50229_10140 [Campylobacterota bacterium]|nr:hypothetical protein AGMMS50229_10140 [Campylobacterota bacterium]